MTNKLTQTLIFEYLPKDLESSFSSETLKIKQQILEEIESSKILDQSYFEIKNIIIQLGKNTHQGHDTFSCRMSIVSDSDDSDFVHLEEGKDYLANLRASVKALIHFARQKNSKNHQNSTNSDNKSFQFIT